MMTEAELDKLGYDEPGKLRYYWEKGELTSSWLETGGCETGGWEDLGMVMTSDERVVWSGLQQHGSVTVYRGHGPEGPGVEGLSWTLEKTTAEWFARRFFRAEGTVITATVDSDAVIAYLDGRNEKEVVLDPYYSKTIVSVETV